MYGKNNDPSEIISFNNFELALEGFPVQWYSKREESQIPKDFPASESWLPVDLSPGKARYFFFRSRLPDSKHTVLFFITIFFIFSLKPFLYQFLCFAYNEIYTELNIILLHFVAFFHVASLLSAGVDNKKTGGRQWKSSRAGQQNIFFIFQSDFNIEILPKNETKHPVRQTFWFKFNFFFA